MTEPTSRNHVDPTRNVRDLVDAAIDRQDDLRESEKEHIREVLRLLSEAGDRDSKCAAEMAELRGRHAHELRLAEAARIDAIRSVDVEATQRTTEVQAAQQAALAANVTATAEAVRVQMATATEAASSRLVTAIDPLQKAIEDLRRSQHEAQGQKAQVVETQAKGMTSAGWASLGVAAVVMVLLVIGTVIAVVSGTGTGG